MRISDWSSDVCSSDLVGMGFCLLGAAGLMLATQLGLVPGGGEALALGGVTLGLGLVGHFVLGALMTLGIGLYGPCLLLISRSEARRVGKACVSTCRSRRSRHD